MSQPDQRTSSTQDTVSLQDLVRRSRPWEAVPFTEELQVSAILGVVVLIVAALWLWGAAGAPASVPPFTFLVLGDAWNTLATWSAILAPFAAVIDGSICLVMAALLGMCAVRRGLRIRWHVLLFATLFVPVANIVWAAFFIAMMLVNLLIYIAIGIVLLLGLCIVLSGET